MRQRRRKPACAIESIEGRVLFTTIYVDANTSGATHDGTSWGNAFTDLQQALTLATVGDEIRVADGTYKPTTTLDRSITFQLKTGVAIVGGFAGDGAANPDLRDIQSQPTILSGDISASGYSYHVVTGSGTELTAVLDGFTITKGSGGGEGLPRGGGLTVNTGSPTVKNCMFTELTYSAVLVHSASPTLTNCTFTGNTQANDNGTAIYLSGGAAPVVTDCTFGGGESTTLVYAQDSAGIFTNCDFNDYLDYALFASYDATTAFSGCTFSPGSAFADGVFCLRSSPSFENCNFSGYRSSAVITSHASPHFSGCVFTDNRDQSGGAIYNDEGSSTSLTNCTFINNVATSDRGGAICNEKSAISLTNCTFIGNTANKRGGAIYNAPTSSMTATGCVMKENVAGNGGAVYNEQASAAYSGCTFEANRATGFGYAGIGAAVLNDTSTASFSNCQFLYNVCATSFSLSTGSTLYNIASLATISGSTFIGNHVANESGSNSSAAAIYNGVGCNAVINDSVFRSNTVANGGSLIYNLSSTQTISNCVFESNRSTNIVSCTGSGSSGSYVDCSFTRNTGRGIGVTTGLIRNCGFFGNTGGGVGVGAGATVVNCMFVGNSATTGAAIVSTGATVINSTILNNSATNGGGISITGPATIANCIIRANTATNGAQIRVVSGSVDVSYSNLQGGFAGTGNIDADPQFVRNPSAGFDGMWRTGDDDYGDLKLRITSSSIDAGNNAAVPAGVITDAAGNARILDVPGKNDPGAIVDMGAYERIAPHADADFLHNAARPSIKITFNNDVLLGTLSASDLVLMNLTTGLPVDCGADSTVTYDAGTRTATWAFSILLADGNYRATLAPGNVHDLADSPILSTELTYDFFALAGDANRDRKVDLADLNALAMNWNGSGKTFSQGDFNYDGTVDAYDLAILSTHWQQNLATHVEAVPVSLKRPASRTPLRVASMVL